MYNRPTQLPHMPREATAMDSYADRLHRAVLDRSSRVCVGLDPRIESLPGALRTTAQKGAAEAAEAYLSFCCSIIEAVADLAPVVKPQAAFFEALGSAGYAALWEVIACARAHGLLVILDAKRGDIGSTAAAYAQAYFEPRDEYPGVDALTVNGYLGSDGVQPFIDAASRTGGGLYVLVKTSNPSSGEIQDLSVETAGGWRLTYQEMARLVGTWGRDLVGESGYSSVGAVVGATYPDQLVELREAFPKVPFLVPGYGAQGGGAEDVVGGFDEKGLGAVVNSSRGILFAYQAEPYSSRFSPAQFAEAAAAATADMRDGLNQALGLS